MEAPFHILEKLGLRASKRLGQNFLIHENTARKIVLEAAPKPGEVVIEIGPGLGAITHVMLETNPVISIEKDPYLFEYLKNTFSHHDHFFIFNEDALEFDYASLTKKFTPPFHVISNLPYSISTPILEKLMVNKKIISKMNFLLQAEVVDRLCAQPNTKNYGRLSIGLQLTCETKRGSKIAPHQFYPKPDVDSRLVELIPKKELVLKETDIEGFLDFVSKLFQKRRKTLQNIFKHMDAPTHLIDPSLLKLRPENLNLEQLISTFNHFKSLT